MKVLVPPVVIGPGTVTPLPPPVVPPEPEIEQDFSTKQALPDIVVPIFDQFDITEKDVVTTRKDEKGPAEPPQQGDKTGDRSGGETGGGNGEVKQAQVFTAALANARDCVLPEYPKNALRNGDTGTVSLALLIGTNGQVTESRIQKSSGFRRTGPRRHRRPEHVQVQVKQRTMASPSLSMGPDGLRLASRLSRQSGPLRPRGGHFHAQ
ncbi:energy transducer TonB [Massilia sp. H-1]|nr:energy transducer TonB [Massilia sp. H-1]